MLLFAVQDAINSLAGISFQKKRLESSYRDSRDSLRYVLRIQIADHKYIVMQGNWISNIGNQFPTTDTLIALALSFWINR